ncbi:MAG: type II secretion system protein [bacterium]|nr:type II secretion system protein [bacterium]
MNKKGFTLVEIILVVVILGIISAITIPNIMESLRQNKVDAGENVEKILLENLKLYTKNNENEWWCDPNTGYGVECGSRPQTGTKAIPLEDLKKGANQDIDMNDCTLKNTMTVTRTGSSGNYKYDYNVKIVCKDKNGKTYYESK